MKDIKRKRKWNKLESSDNKNLQNCLMTFLYEKRVYESFSFIMKGRWQILSSYQPTVNYAKDDLQIQLPFISEND